MAYMNQERKAVIQTALKPILKKYGVKGTLRVRNHMTISLTVKSGEIDFIGNFNERVRATRPGTQYQFAEGSIDVNPYWFQDHFTGRAKVFLAEAFQALKSAGWYDRSDAQTDYFDTAYYVDINIGRWDQPYALVK